MVRKGKKKELHDTAKTVAPSNGAQTIKPTQTRPPRPKPVALMVRKDGEDFPELLKTVRSGVNPEVTGNSIGRLRKTRNGDLLVVINGGNGPAETVKAEITRALGAGATVRKLENSSVVEIRDLDAETTKEEVLNAVNSTCKEGNSKLVSLRKVVDDTQTAVVSLQSMAAKRLCESGRLRVGLVYARVRPTELPPRCFRCLAFGHVLEDCKGPDRSRCCWRCGDAGHFRQVCTADVVQARTFMSSLSAKTARVVKPSDSHKGGTTQEPDRLCPSNPTASCLDFYK